MARSSKRLSRLAGLAIASSTLPFVSGCTPVPSSRLQGSDSSSRRILVSAATSLVDAIAAIDPLFEQVNPTIQVDYNFAASGTLQRQIEQGAPVDVFVSAAVEPMDALERQGAIASDTRQATVANDLVLVVPARSTLNLSGFEHLTNPDVRTISVGELQTVPAGKYAAEVLAARGVLEDVRSRFVFARSARGVLAAVERGHVDAGIVYATDAATSDRVRTVAVASAGDRSPIVYPAAALTRSPELDAARAYVEFLNGDRARNVFQTMGFKVSVVVP